LFLWKGTFYEKNKIIYLLKIKFNYLYKLVHNSVNQRLSGDVNHEQDTEHPKVQFPTKNQCPKCYKILLDEKDYKKDNYEWNTEEVLKFLIEHYSKHKISMKTDKISTSSSSLKTYSSTVNDYLLEDEILNLIELDELEEEHQLIWKSFDINNLSNKMKSINQVIYSSLLIYFFFLK
jgi:hypothetical protein